MRHTPRRSAGLTRSGGPPQALMAGRDRMTGSVAVMEEVRRPGTDCGCLLCYWSSPRSTEAGRWAETSCSPSPPPERHQSEILRNVQRNVRISSNPQKTNAHVSQSVSVLSNLCVKNGLRISLHDHRVGVWSREGVLLKILKFGLHVHCNQTGPRGSGSGVCCIRALLNHSHTVIVFEGSLQST